MFQRGDGAPLHSFKLKHYSEGQSKGSTVDDILATDSETAESIAEQAYVSAMSDAAVSSGVHRYVLYAYWGVEEIEQWGGRATFAVVQRGDDEDDELGSMSTTEQGQLAQLQRHLEGLYRTQAMLVQGVTGTLAEALRDERENSRMLQMRVIDMTMEREKIISERSTREIAARESLANQKMWSDLFDKLTIIVPALLIKNKEGSNLNMVNPAILGILRALQKDKRRAEQIISLLNAESQMAMFQALGAIAEAKESAREDEAKVNSEVAKLVNVETPKLTGKPIRGSSTPRLQRDGCGILRGWIRSEFVKVGYHFTVC